MNSFMEVIKMKDRIKKKHGRTKTITQVVLRSGHPRTINRHVSNDERFNNMYNRYLALSVMNAKHISTPDGDPKYSINTLNKDGVWSTIKDGLIPSEVANEVFHGNPPKYILKHVTRGK